MLVIVIQAIYYSFQIYFLMLFARILSSWVPEINRYKVMQWIGKVTDPYLDIFRRFIPPIGMIDISPIVAFLALAFLQNLLIQMIIQFFR